jgi:hypothetical protein
MAESKVNVVRRKYGTMARSIQHKCSPLFFLDFLVLYLSTSFSSKTKTRRKCAASKNLKCELISYLIWTFNTSTVNSKLKILICAIQSILLSKSFK